MKQLNAQNQTGIGGGPDPGEFKIPKAQIIKEPEQLSKSINEIKKMINEASLTLQVNKNSVSLAKEIIIFFNILKEADYICSIKSAQKPLIKDKYDIDKITTQLIMSRLERNLNFNIYNTNIDFEKCDCKMENIDYSDCVKNYKRLKDMSYILEDENFTKAYQLIHLNNKSIKTEANVVKSFYRRLLSEEKK